MKHNYTIPILKKVSSKPSTFSRKLIFRSLLVALLSFISFKVDAQVETESNDTPTASGVQRIYDDTGFSGTVESAGDVDYWQISKTAGDLSTYTLRLDIYNGTSQAAPVFLEKRSGGYDGTLISDVRVRSGFDGTQFYNLNIDYSGGDFYYVLKMVNEGPSAGYTYDYSIKDFSPATCTDPFSNTTVAVTSVTDTSLTINGLTFSAILASFGDRFLVSVSDTGSFTNHTDGFMDISVNTAYSGSGDQVVYTSDNGTITNPNIVVTGLDPNKEYFVKATVARDCTGYYKHSTGQTVSATTCGVIPAPITAVNLSPESETQFRINSFTGGSTNHGSSTLGYVVKLNTVDSFTNPSSGASLPTANSVYSGSGEQVIYAGNSATPNLAVTGLSSFTNYYVKVYTYNSCSGNNYFESTGFNTTLLSCGPPPTGYNNFLATTGGSVKAYSLAPVYNRDNNLVPSGLIIYINTENSFTDPEATYTTLPVANNDYQGAGQQAVVVGGLSSFFATTNNLIPNTTYYFRSYPYYTCGGTSYVNLTDFQEINLTTCNYSDNLASSPSFGNITDTSMEFNSFTALSPEAPATAPDGYVIRMNTINSFSSITNGTAVPTGNTNYSGSGEQVIYSGNSTSPNLNITGLSANTTYFFNIVAYYPSCDIDGILYQQAGYTFSKTNDASLVSPTITFNDIEKVVGDPNFNLVATSNSGGAISYQILNQTGLQTTTLSGTNNATVTLGTAGTVTIEATQEPSGGFAGGTATATLTITAPDATIGGDPFLLINSTLDLSTRITTNSNGAITYSIVDEPLGSSISGNILTSGTTPGGIIVKVSQEATLQYAATEFYTLVLIWDGTNFKFDRVFNLFDTTLQPGETFQLQEAKSFQNSAPVTYTIVPPDVTGSSVNNTTNVFTAGNPGSVILRATSPDGNFYNASSKDVTITIEGTSQTITFNALSDVTYGGANFNLTATASSGLAVSYVSSDPTIASISGSTVTIHKAGTVNITASQAGGGIYLPAPDVIQSLTVNPIIIVNQNVSLDTTGSVLCSTSATVSIDGSQTSVNYYLRDNSDNSIIEGPVAGTGNAISFATEQLSSDKTYNVIAVQDNQMLPTATNTLQMTATPLASVQTLDVKTVGLSQPDGQSAVVSVENSQAGVVYYLQDNATNEVLQGPLTGTEANVSFTSDAITADKTYKVIGTDANSSNGLRNTLRFDNVDDYVSIAPINSQLTNIGEATIETWVKIPTSDATDVDASIITFEGYGGDLASIVVPFYINISGGQIFAGNYNDDFDDGGPLNTPSYTYPVDTWFHVAATINGSSISFYVNGNLVGTNPSNQTFETFVLTSNIRLGRNYQNTSDSSKIFGGYLAQTRIWNGVRTQSEISSNMSTEFTNPQTNLVLNYNYDQTSGTSVTDESGNSNTGTLQNAAGDATNWVKDLFTNSPCGFVNMNNTVTATYAPLQDQIITFNSLSDVTYGDADFALTATSDSGLTVTYTSSDTSVATISGDTVTIVGEGTATITASQAGDATYNPATDVQQSLTVNKRDIVLIISGSKEYGEPEPNISYSLFPGSSLVSGDAFSGSLVREPGEDVGNYTINLGTLTAGPNYNISFFIPPTFDIYEREIEVTADSGTKVEGETDPALTYQITSGSLVSGDSFTGSLERNTGEAIGDYPITQGTLALGTNYQITFVGNTFSITRDALARWDGSTSSAWNVVTNFEDDIT
uniref:beta strand repeat-containing protein n=1 Tax=Tenacibaculum agarivorans TaxID=1908389 RepID=UPI000A9B982C